ncbi:MAG: hypothetical protein QNJ32_23845 [Xenococcaceae cyanobacterium MO_167.B27]|nr:hypothetical protein [Xenococcaceae cyanobacterium MO_167.B27]
MKENLSFKTYSISYIISLGLLLASVFIFNIAIDPYGDFRLINIQGINTEKILADSGGERRSKANDITYGEYDTIILGTSRALRTLDPNHPVFKNRKAYNLSLRGSNIYEIYQVYNYARKKQALKTVVFPLDFLTFTDKRTVSGDFKSSQFYLKPYSWGFLKYNLSIDQLFLSLKTIKNNLEGIKANNSSGFMPFGKEVEDYRKAFDGILTGNFLVNQQTYAGYSYSQNRLDLFRKIVADCLANDIELYLFISPVHARQLEAISIMGLFPTFEQWKQDLVTIVEEEATKLNKPAPLLWDFSGYNSITTEAIPLPGETGTMQWYRESSHYSKKLGDILLDIIFNYPQKVAGVSEDFGTIITTKNIEEHLTKIRQAQKQYQIDHSFEVSEVTRLFTGVSSPKN